MVKTNRFMVTWEIVKQMILCSNLEQRKGDAMKLADKDVKEVEKVGVKERDILVWKDPPKFIKEVTIRYDHTTKKGRGISQIIDGLGRIIE